jgi:hypothetical protein
MSEGRGGVKNLQQGYSDNKVQRLHGIVSSDVEVRDRPQLSWPYSFNGKPKASAFRDLHESCDAVAFGLPLHGPGRNWEAGDVTGRSA